MINSDIQYFQLCLQECNSNKSLMFSKNNRALSSTFTKVQRDIRKAKVLTHHKYTFGFLEVEISGLFDSKTPVPYKIINLYYDN